MSLFGRKEKEGGTATSVALAEEPGAITKPKLMSHTIIQSLSRAKLAAVTHYVALIETGAVPNDPEYISNFYRNLVPGDVGGMAPKSTLNALRRDTGGLASWVADISTVATVVFRVDPFRNIVFAKAEKRIAAATQWKNEIDEALAVGEIVRASAMLVDRYSFWPRELKTRMRRMASCAICPWRARYASTPRNLAPAQTKPPVTFSLLRVRLGGGTIRKSGGRTVIWRS